ncbi:MAG: LysR family transcriptional regulator [Cellvibrio sp.]|uniref:LysR family transcriptional regulator n=1 Tax=Cellvibrio sp. TaxID=1965322 RepID=UPI0031B3ABAA
MANLFDINLNRLVVFAAVVETGSITAAAKRLGLAKTMVSAHMQKLEAEIGSNLLVRTTRRLHLTEAGSGFYEACQKILRDTELAITQANSNTRQLRGKLRIAASIDYGASVIAPLAVQLNKEHPELHIDIIANDHRIDMVAEGIDVSIRIGRLADSSHKAALIAPFEEFLVASADFFAGDLPESPEQLDVYPFVGLSVLPNPLYWTFTRNNFASVTLRFHSSIMTNTSLAVQSAVLAGAGIAVLPDYSVKKDIAEGRLVRLLPEWSLPGGGIYAVFPALIQRSQKVSVFIEALKQRYS